MKEWAEIIPDAQKFDRAIGTAMAYATQGTVDTVVAAMRTNHRWQSRSGETYKSIRGRSQSTVKGSNGLIMAAGMSLLLNDGTPPHVIRARRAKALRFTAGGDTLFRREVNHPGTKPDPFLDDAETLAEREFYDTFDRMFDGLFD